MREPVEHEVEVRLDGEPDEAPTRSRRMPTRRLPASGSSSSSACTRTVGSWWSPLINGQEEPEQTKDTAWLFQTKLVVTRLRRRQRGVRSGRRPAGEPRCGHRRPRGAAPAAALPPRAAGGQRPQRRCAPARSDPRQDGAQARDHLAPDARRPRHYRAHRNPGTELEDAELSMDTLAGATATRLQVGLYPLVEGYQTWLDGRDEEASKLPTVLRGRAQAAVETGPRGGRAAAGRHRSAHRPDEPAPRPGARRVPLREPRHGRTASPHRDRPSPGRRRDPELPGGEGRRRRLRRGRCLVAPVSARFRADQPAVAGRPRPPGARRRRHRIRRPPLLPHRRRQDGGLPRADRVHVRDPAAARQRWHWA